MGDGVLTSVNPKAIKGIWGIWQREFHRWFFMNGVLTSLWPSVFFEYAVYSEESTTSIIDYPGEVKLSVSNKVHCMKRLAIFPSPAGMSQTKPSLAGNNFIIPGHEEFGYWHIPAGDGKIANFFSVLSQRLSELFPSRIRCDNYPLQREVTIWWLPADSIGRRRFFDVGESIFHVFDNELISTNIRILNCLVPLTSACSTCQREKV